MASAERMGLGNIYDKEKYSVLSLVGHKYELVLLPTVKRYISVLYLLLPRTFDHAFQVHDLYAGILPDPHPSLAVGGVWRTRLGQHLGNTSCLLTSRKYKAYTATENEENTIRNTIKKSRHFCYQLMMILFCWQTNPDSVIALLINYSHIFVYIFLRGMHLSRLTAMVHCMLPAMIIS